MKMTKYRIREICALNKTSLKKNDLLQEIIYLDTSNITENKIDNLQLFSISEAPSRAQRKVQNNTILFSTVRPNQNHFGILKNPQENLIVSSGFTTLDVIDENQIDSSYLYFKLTQPFVVNYLQTVAQNSVSAYPSINPDDIGNLLFEFPELDYQRKIAAVLSSLDDKIALNNRINAKLESMAKRLYDYWFVQFDFPNEDGKPYKSSGGKMVWSEELKREIPAGWEVRKISEVLACEIHGDWGEENIKGKHDYKVSCIRGCDMVDMTDLPTRYILRTNAKKLLQADDFVIEISGGSPTQSTGRIVQVTEEIINRFDNKVMCSNFCHGVRVANKNYISYFYQMWNMFYNNGVFFNFEGKTSGLKNFQFDTFVDKKWYFPPEDFVKQFNETTVKFRKQIDKNESENLKLSAMRDKLLPLLMNGQVSVKE